VFLKVIFNPANLERLISKTLFKSAIFCSILADGGIKTLSTTSVEVFET